MRTFGISTGDDLALLPAESRMHFIPVVIRILRSDDRHDIAIDTLHEVIKSLLGNVCVCENIDLASVIAKKFGYKFKIVTLDGQIVNAGGSYTGGSISKSTGILSRKNEIDQIQKDKEELSQKLKDLEKQVEMI